MALWNEVRINELPPDFRFDAEYYTHPGYFLVRRLNDAGKPFDYFFPRVIHPGEFARSYVEEDGYLFLRAQNVRPGHIEVDDPLYVSANTYRSLPEAVAREHNLLLVRTGANHGDLARVTKRFDGALVSSHTLRLIPSPNCPVHAFEFFFASKIGRSLLLSLRSGGTHGQINGAALETLYLPDLSTFELEAILYSKAIEEKTLKSETLYTEAGRLLLSELGLLDLDLSPTLFYERTFSETKQTARLDAEFFQPKYQRLLENISACPFRKATLGDLIAPIKNGLDYREFSEKGLPYIRVGDVSKGRIKIENAKRVNIQWEDIGKSIRLKVGDVLLTRKGSYGNAAFVREGQTDSIISSEIMLLRIMDSSLLPEYLTVFLNSPAGFQQIERFVHGVAFYSISQPDLSSVRVIVAPTSIQNRIAALVRKAEAARDESRRLLEEAKRMVEQAVLGGKR